MIKSFKSLLVLSALVVLFSGAFAGAAIAQNSEGTPLILEEPLELGGTVLEPGTYMITVMPGDHRNVLKVTNEDGTETLATALTVPHATMATMKQKETQYVYFPAAADSPRVLRTWFAPDSETGAGYDVVYPKMRAMKLATLAKGPVVTYPDGTSAADLETVKLEVVAQDQEVMAYMPPKAAPMTEEEKPMAVAKVSDMPSADRPYADREELPRTASSMPFLGALGLLLLLAAGGVWILRTVQQ